MSRTVCYKFGCLLLALALVLGAFGTAFAARWRCEDLDFAIMNNSGKTIKRVYLSPSEYDEWVPADKMNDYPLHHGEYVEVDFPDRCELSQPYDLRVEYRDGSYDEWTDVDLYQANEMAIESVGSTSFLTTR